jgi:hypothetical protein
MTWTRGPLQVPARAPIEAVLDVTITDIVRQLSQIRSLRFEGSWNIDGREIAHAEARMRCVPPGAFRALRRGRPRPTSPVTAPTRALSQDSVGRTLVGWDPFDPMIFDHPLDHVPGMVMIDAGLEAAEAFRAFGIEFFSFAEFSEPIYLQRERTDGPHRSFTITQNGQLVARVDTTI